MDKIVECVGLDKFDFDTINKFIKTILCKRYVSEKYTDSWWVEDSFITKVRDNLLLKFYVHDFKVFMDLDTVFGRVTPKQALKNKGIFLEKACKVFMSKYMKEHKEIYKGMTLSKVCKLYNSEDKKIRNKFNYIGSFEDLTLNIFKFLELAETLKKTSLKIKKV